ncbi:MAG: hemerythrin domain-containing protein [Streptosporangiaceae bacterium]|nr:hemerythrin domain-containing protein [Streptosporangiaceae bacterium]MBV9854538.1 hemerythrin domain-containing protein [Streptosporangiaceae bacterium]
MGFNFHEGQGDCYNPTEPGAWDDDITTKWGVDSAGYGWNQYPWLGPSTTAILTPPSYPSATSVTTRTRLAMWLADGEKDAYCPGGASYPAASPYTYQLSPYVLTKTVTVGPLPELSGLPDVMRIDAGLKVESTPGVTPADGVFVTYLRCDFTSWWKLAAGSNTFAAEPGPAGNPPSDASLVSAQEGISGRHVDVLIAATPDGSQAFALYSPKALNSAAPGGEQEYEYLQDSPAGCGYGKQLSDQITFPTASRRAGNYHYRIYAAFGTLAQVKTAVKTMRNDAALSSLRPVRRTADLPGRYRRLSRHALGAAARFAAREAGGTVDITQLILDDHHEQRRLFAILEQVDRTDTATLSAVWDRLSAFLELHAAAEEELFYPALLQVGLAARRRAGVEEETVDAIHDHNEIRDAIAEAAGHPVGSDAWYAAVAATNAANSDHMAEEEREGLTDFRRLASLQQRHSLAVAFAAFEARNYAGVQPVDKDPEAYVREEERAVAGPQAAQGHEGSAVPGGSLSIGSLKER